MNNLSPRTKTLIYAGIALLALLFLASTLNTLQLDPGSPLPFSQAAPPVYDQSLPEIWQRIMLAIIRVMLILVWVLLPVFIIMLIVSKEARKRFVRDMMIFLPILFMIYMLSRRKFEEGAVQDINPGAFGMQNMQGDAGPPAAPLPEFTPPPDWVTAAATVALAVVVALLLAAILIAIYRRSRQPEPLTQIQQEAQAALDAIEAGGDLRDVILRSYQQMLQALQQYRNIRRDRDMTPHEFEDYLARRGLPAEPVRQLTRLFEQVRYGGLAPGRQEERLAIASLSAIVSACEKWSERQA